MNSNINKLFGQALDQAVPETWSYLTSEQMEAVVEKFAELLIKECALTAGLMEHEGRTGIGAVLLDKYGVEQ